MLCVEYIEWFLQTTFMNIRENSVGMQYFIVLSKTFLSLLQ